MFYAIYMATRPQGFVLVLVPVYFIKHSVSCYIYYVLFYTRIWRVKCHVEVNLLCRVTYVTHHVWIPWDVLGLAQYWDLGNWEVHSRGRVLRKSWWWAGEHKTCCWQYYHPLRSCRFRPDHEPSFLLVYQSAHSETETQIRRLGSRTSVRDRRSPQLWHHEHHSLLRGERTLQGHSQAPAIPQHHRLHIREVYKTCLWSERVDVFTLSSAHWTTIAKRPGL